MIFDLINASPKYRDLSVAEIYDAILSAEPHGRMITWNDWNRLIGFMTWSFIPENKVRAFLANEYAVRGDDFACQNGELFVLDFIAPYGNVRTMMRDAQRYFSERYGDGTLVRWKRSKRIPAKTGYAVARWRYDMAA